MNARSFALCFCLLLPSLELLLATEVIIPDSGSIDLSIDRALRAEVEGNTALKKELLSQVTSQSPNSVSARGILGQVALDDTWVKTERAEMIAGANPLRKEYEQLKARLPKNSEAAEVSLARWCAKHDLKDEEQIHWRNVLRLNPRHPLARRSADLRWLNGEWISSTGFEEFRDKSQQQVRADREWYIKLTPMLNHAIRLDKQRRESALEQLRLIRDPAACKAMCRAYESIAAKSPDRGVDVALAIIDSLKSIPEVEGTWGLVQFAIWPNDTATRDYALQGLKDRKLTDFVPYLMNAMLEVKWIDQQPGGGDGLFSFAVEGANAVRLGSVAYWNRTFPERAAIQRIARNSDFVNTRVQTILANVTSEDVGTKPSAWWEYWRGYNDLEYPQKNIVQTARTQARPMPPTRSCECFPAGTPVATLTGLRPIEELKVGDRVLSQDVDSGELAYKPIVDTTLRIMRPTLAVKVAGEEIAVTRGHRFWVTGYGWRMAKHLNVGDRIRSETESRMIESIEEDEDRNVFNLVVEQNSNYFVGESRLLVHDNSCPKATVSLVPGWAKYCHTRQ